MAELNIGVIGLGYWGPNLLRNFKDISGVRVMYMCDLDIRNLEKWREKNPDVYPSKDVDELFKEKGLEVVVISTPASTHYELAKKALEHGKHVFLEKPMAKSVEECSDLIEVAEKKGRVLMVGHVYEYSPFLNYLKQYISNGSLGKPEEGWATRFALGPIRSDVNALWDLASHDIGILISLFQKRPLGVSANGKIYDDGIKQSSSVAMHLYFEDDIEGDIRVSWRAPKKTRELILMGDKQIACFDEVASDENLKIYNRCIEYVEADETFQRFRSKIRKGDSLVPFIEVKEEPLKTECRHFVDCIKNGGKPITDGSYGLDVVRVILAAEKSMKEKRTVEITK